MLIKAVFVGFDESGDIERVDSLNPAISKFVFESASSEVEPASVKITSNLVRPSHPNQHRCRVSDHAKAFLGFSQALFHTPALGNIDNLRNDVFGLSCLRIADE